jgi:hypothetical protein
MLSGSTQRKTFSSAILVEVNVKVKVSCPCVFKSGPRHEVVLGSGGIAPRIPDFGTRWS